MNLSVASERRPPRTQTLSKVFTSNALLRPPGFFEREPGLIAPDGAVHIVPWKSHQADPLWCSKRLLVLRTFLFLALGRDFETLLGRVKDQLDLLDQAVLLLLQLGVLLNSLLDE